MTPEENMAFITGMAKFASENNVDLLDFLKVATVSGGMVKKAAVLSPIAVKAALRAARKPRVARSPAARVSGRRAASTISKPTPGSGAAVAAAAPTAKPPTAAERAALLKPKPKVNDLGQYGRQALDWMRNNNALTAGIGAGGLYGAGVTKDYVDMATGSDEYDLSVWDKILMFLNLKRQPGLLDPLDQFGIFR